MVLSHKKLKQRLRSLVTESLASNESKDSRMVSSSADNVNQELQGMRDLLFSKYRKSKLLKREKRVKSKSLPNDFEKADGKLVAGEVNTKRVKSNSLPNDLKNADGKLVAGEVNTDIAGNQELEGHQKKEKKSGKKKKAKKKKKKRELKLIKKGNDNVELRDENKNDSLIKSVNYESKMPEEAMPVQVNDSEKKKVYVGGIPYYSSEDDIISFFQDCGTITELDCMTFPETGRFRGIAILTFKTEGGAERALALDGSDMGGFFLKIKPYRAARSQRSDFAPEIIEGYHRVYVGNLSWDISEDDLKQLFSDCKISSIRFGTDKETGDFKGYAHVDFADSASLAIALQLDQRVLYGRPVRIRCAVPRKSIEAESKLVSCRKEQEGGKVGGGASAGADAVPVGRKKQEGGQVGDGAAAGADAIPAGRKPKRKRQTCYECGTPGHLSAECPRRSAGAGQVAAS